jgi:predicted glutamine amidotransferase
MCRWVAYAGASVYMKDILFDHENSLVGQSVHARQSAVTTNGDGFGVAWYGDHYAPGLFRDILPAWNDENLRSLAQQIRSSLFFAHVRASTGTGISRANCHPFVYENWCFMHNGRIGDWPLLRRDVEHMIDPALFGHRLGTTDSEAIFLIALSHGLMRDPERAMRRTLRDILRLQAKHASAEPLRFSAALTDGSAIHAFRFSSDHQSPSVVYGTRRGGADDGLVDIIASEPYDDPAMRWAAVSEGEAIAWRNGRIEHHAFDPVAA